MKKLMAFFCLVVSLFPITVETVFAQNNADSLKSGLVSYTNPIERFTATINYLENIDSYQGSIVDSAICIDLLQIARQLKNDSLLAISYNWIGYYFFQNKGDNTAALEYFFKALPFAEKVNDKRRISSLYFDIGSVYYLLKNVNEFYSFSKKGGEHLPDNTSSKYDYMLVQYQRNMGIAYLEKNELDSALYYAQAAVQTSDRLKLKLFKFQTLHLLGIVYARVNEVELADIYFTKALVLSDSIISEVRKMSFFQRYIPFLIKNNRMAEAKLQTDEVWIMSTGTQNLNFKLAAAVLKREWFDKLDNSDSAYYYSKVESQIRELIFNQNNLNTIQALAFKEQLRIIEDTAKQTEEAQQRKQNIQYALLGLGIISFVILFLALSRRHITNTKLIQFLGIIALLLVFEFLNLLLHPFLERITNHSPVLMLLALVCIAALLVPMHHKLEKWTTHKLVEKNKQIRLAAAKKTIEELEKD